MSAPEQPPVGLEHWPDDIWTDYPRAYIRLTTLRVARMTHLLFGCVELVPREIPPLPDYDVPQLKLRQGASAKSSLRVVDLEAAIRWYEASVSQRLTIPGTRTQGCIQSVRLAPEPRLGRLVVSTTQTVPVACHLGLRMHRMVPMDDLPAGVTDLLTDLNDGAKLRAWLRNNCFFDLVACPDCAGGLVMLAPNPILRAVSEYPSRTLPDGREVIGVRAVPRSGCSLNTIRLRFSELRLDGYSTMQEVSLDDLGEAEVTLPQKAQKTAIEVICTKRGLLSLPPHTAFLRSVSSEIWLSQDKMTVSVPPRTASRRGSRYDVAVSSCVWTVTGSVGHLPEGGAAYRLAELLRARPPASDAPAEEVVFRDDLDDAASFVRNLVSHARSRVIFVDRYFSFDDIREFSLAVRSGSCSITVLTGSEQKWSAPLAHLCSAELHGDILVKDLDYVNARRRQHNLSAIDVRVMCSPSFHDRFLVVDDAVWLFGGSFRSLGSGAISVAVKMRNAAVLLPTLIAAVEAAEPFDDYWSRTKKREPVP